jgi:hypothetical protein
MFVHKCGTPVVLDTTSSIRIRTTFTLGKGVLRLGSSSLTSSQMETKPVFFCPSCGVEVPIEELLSACMHCGTSLTISNLFRITGEFGAWYCKECITNSLHEKPGASILTVISKAYIK